MILQTDIKVLPVNVLQRDPLCIVMDKGRIDDIRVEFEGAVASQSLDNSPLAKDAGRAFEEFSETGSVHFSHWSFYCRVWMKRKPSGTFIYNDSIPCC